MELQAWGSMTYTIDQVLGCLDALDLEDVYITSIRTKVSISARVAYATSCKAGQKMKGLVVLVPDNTTAELETVSNASFDS